MGIWFCKIEFYDFSMEKLHKIVVIISKCCIKICKKYVVLRAIRYHLYYWKNVKSIHEGVLLLVLRVTLLQGCFSRLLNCVNGIKSHKAPHIRFKTDINYCYSFSTQIRLSFQWFTWRDFIQKNKRTVYLTRGVFKTLPNTLSFLEK